MKPADYRQAPEASGADDAIVKVAGLNKTYASGFAALKNVDLAIRRGEIFALLGPNGAGKTTLISIICGIVNPSSGTVVADGHDIRGDYRAARAKIGLVPQELHTDAFETVWATVRFRRGEIFALLGPNGAGKTTLISIVCGLVNPTAGRVLADGHDIVTEYRAARAKIGLVPQELTTDAFETVWATVSFSRGLFGKPANPAHIERVLKDLSLWDKRDSRIRTVSAWSSRV